MDEHEPVGTALLDDFLRLEALGLRREAKAAVAKLLAHVHSPDAQDAWTAAHLNRLRTNGAARIRHEIFTGIVLPSLLRADERGEAEASFLLGALHQNLMACRELWEQFDHASASSFFEEACTRNPTEERYTRAYLEARINELGYAFHEWPIGILVGPENLDRELDVLEAELQALKRRDQAGNYGALLDRWLGYVAQYRARFA